MLGKLNKDFLAKPKAARKPSGNMTVDNVKDRPDLPRTNDMDVIRNYFVYYCTSTKKSALDRLIKNLTLMLDKEEVEELDKPITSKEMVRALVDSPKGKSLGMDSTFSTRSTQCFTLQAATNWYTTTKGISVPSLRV
jgi:hypothetical protein